MEKLTFEEMKEMAKIFYKAGACNGASEDQIFMLMAVTQAKGISAALVAERYGCIKGKNMPEGRPFLKTAAIQSDFYAAGGKITWIERSDKAAEANFFHSLGGSVNVRWTLDDMRRIGRKDTELWQKFPRSMLSARVIAEGIKAVYPALCGFVLDEESEMDKSSRKRQSAETKEVAADNAGTFLSTEEKATEDSKKSERKEKIIAVREICKTQFKCKSKSDFENLTENMTGHRCSKVDQLTDDELETIIQFCEEKTEETVEPVEPLTENAVTEECVVSEAEKLDEIMTQQN